MGKTTYDGQKTSTYGGDCGRGCAGAVGVTDAVCDAVFPPPAAQQIFPLHRSAAADDLPKQDN